ncbi:uncharacterized protein DDB_G0286299-like [Papaver somniferum]|uniref:uncharacterized protein DDB_G0286299-like n=1 Tax=Papaver somniferum TaxID=3469 RepID=UPI000E6FE448|nr:uncharacterized protein DDB_G0286299-like [Papaver somniferum]
MRRKKLDEELTEVLDRKERLLSFIEEKRLKVNEVGLMSLTEREANEFRNYTLHEIFKCAKEIRLETEEDEEIEEEEEEDDKGGDMHDHDNDKEGSKGGDDEHGTESERNKVPSETPEKQSTPSPKTNEANEEDDGKDGTSKGVEAETGNKPSTLLPKEVEIPEGQEEHMNLNDQHNAQTDEIDKVAGCEAANKQSTSMPKTSVINEDKQDQVNLDDQNVMDDTRTTEIDEATIIAAEAICQLDPKEVLLLTQGEESQNETYTSIEDLLDNYQEVEEEKTTPVRTRARRMKEEEMLKTQASGKLSTTPQKRNEKRKLDPEFTAEGKTKRVVIKADPKGKGIKVGQEPGYPAPIKRKGDVYRPHNPLPDVRLSPLYHAMQPGQDKKRVQKFFDYASME